MAELVRYAAVGCGGMGRRHLRGMAALKRASFCNLELAAAVDVKQEAAELLAGEAEQLLGARPPVYTSIEDAVRAVPDLRAADVTVESGFHHLVGVACLEAGLHVLCEKPLAVTVRGCTLLIETARRAGKILSTAENFRRDPIHRLARALLTDGAIGEPRLVLQSSIGGGDRISMTIWRHMKHSASMPVDAGVHEADLLRYYMGEFHLVYGQSRLHEKVRFKGAARGAARAAPAASTAPTGTPCRSRSSPPGTTPSTPTSTSAAAPPATGSTTTPGTASAGTSAPSLAPGARSSAPAIAAGVPSRSTWTAGGR